MIAYIGKLNYHPYSQDEIFSVIFDTNLLPGDGVAVIHQWTRDASGKSKSNSFAQGTVSKSVILSPGEKEVEFLYNERETYYYWYKGRQTGAKLILSMYNKGGEEVAKNIELVAVYY
ncbi:hypothetical protein BO94DRAFT_580161 [Aspergillus sclerotioniger CBS 115572]|uniref:Uncharacterized protein n=1 Tax=Aspergillus sclerotioniger CBS 115572 TaxID=1450535 RepID=A0A317XCQ6_9EURO|nr:hypothetical protein BO94DRAFT_580161 [Aspergillus sclerotioniger CBS 115572]PWY96299.1 hypothetical protein BO94DRAFT_580161 [Aspergillus sclerotioniger CBS 115572]